MTLKNILIVLSISLTTNMVCGQTSRKSFGFQVSPGYHAGVLETDFLAFTDLRVSDLSRFYNSQLSLIHNVYLEPTVRFKDHFFGLKLGYVFSNASYPNSTFDSRGASGDILPSDLRYVSTSYGAINFGISYGYQLRFRKGYLIPSVSLGVGFVERMKVRYQAINEGGFFESNNTAAPSALTRNPLIIDLACYYQSKRRRSGKGLMVNYKVGPYLGVISNGEFDKIFFLNGGVSLQFPFSF